MAHPKHVMCALNSGFSLSLNLKYGKPTGVRLLLVSPPSKINIHNLRVNKPNILVQWT